MNTLFECDDIREGDIIVCIETDSPYNIGDEFIIESVSCRISDETDKPVKSIYFIDRRKNMWQKGHQFELGSLRSKQFALSLKTIRKRKLEQINAR
jgi:hypothetical protein